MKDKAVTLNDNIYNAQPTKYTTQNGFALMWKKMHFAYELINIGYIIYNSTNLKYFTIIVQH